MSDGDEVRVYPVGIYDQESEEEPRPPLLVLRDDVGREIQIPIGACEGLGINIALQQHPVQRPLTHDLALNILERLNGKLERVVIDNFPDGDACYATLSLSTPRGLQPIRARAGDGVALALRAELPIYVTEEVFLRASTP